MRVELRQKLIDTIPEIEGRAYEPHAAGLETAKPYLVVRQGAETDDTQWLGNQDIVEVWPYLARTSFQQVDSLCTKVLNALDKKMITLADGQVCFCLYAGSTGEDIVDEEWDAITRGLRFLMVMLPAQITMDPDPIAALQNWVSTKLPELEIDSSKWSLTDQAPGLYFRLETWRPVKQTAAVTWIEATVMAHVLAPTAGGRLPWIKKLTESALWSKRTPMADGSPLFFMNIAADSTADPLRKGQVKLTVHYGLLPPQEESVPIQHIGFSAWGKKGVIS